MLHTKVWCSFLGCQRRNSNAHPILLYCPIPMSQISSSFMPLIKYSSQKMPCNVHTKHAVLFCLSERKSNGFSFGIQTSLNMKKSAGFPLTTVHSVGCYRIFCILFTPWFMCIASSCSFAAVTTTTVLRFCAWKESWKMLWPVEFVRFHRSAMALRMSPVIFW